MLIALNKPYGVICQFSPHEKHRSLKDFVPVPNVYPAGRLDTDSEGLLLLTDDGRQQARIANPRFKLTKTYWAQLEGSPDDERLTLLQRPAHPRRNRSHLAARPAHSRAQKRAGFLAANSNLRREKPPGAADDGQSGLSLPAADSGRHRQGEPI